MPRDLSKKRLSGAPADLGVSSLPLAYGGNELGAFLSHKQKVVSQNTVVSDAPPKSGACCGSCADGKACEGDSKILGMQPLLFIALVGGLVYMASR